MSELHETFERRPCDPTPTEIRRRAASIRKRWSKSLRSRRRVGIAPTWQPPLILGVDWMRVLTQEFVEAPYRER